MSAPKNAADEKPPIAGSQLGAGATTIRAMTHAQQRMAQGLCPDCPAGKLQHGPWMVEQIAAAAEDVGMPPADFVDACDDCFVEQVGRGDVAWAQSLCPDRALQLNRQHG